MKTKTVFIMGFIFCWAFIGLYQDIIGKEQYIKYCNEKWISGYITVPIEIILLLLAGFSPMYYPLKMDREALMLANLKLKKELGVITDAEIKEFWSILAIIVMVFCLGWVSGESRLHNCGKCNAVLPIHVPQNRRIKG